MDEILKGTRGAVLLAFHRDFEYLREIIHENNNKREEEEEEKEEIIFMAVLVRPFIQF